MVALILTVKQMSAFGSALDSGSGIVDLATQMPTLYVEQALDGVYAGCSPSDFSSSPLSLPSTSAFTDVAGPGYGLEWLDGVCSGWSAVDFSSSPIDPVWPSPLNDAAGFGGGLDGLGLGCSPDDFTFFPHGSCSAPDALASAAGLGGGLTACGLPTYCPLPATHYGQEHWSWNVPCHFQAL